jgi:hypothetical protein
MVDECREIEVLDPALVNLHDRMGAAGSLRLVLASIGESTRSR